jgi:hypothetical protein
MMKQISCSETRCSQGLDKQTPSCVSSRLYLRVELNCRKKKKLKRAKTTISAAEPAVVEIAEADSGRPAENEHTGPRQHVPQSIFKR